MGHIDRLFPSTAGAISTALTAIIRPDNPTDAVTVADMVGLIGGEGVFTDGMKSLSDVPSTVGLQRKVPGVLYAAGTEYPDENRADELLTVETLSALSRTGNHYTFTPPSAAQEITGVLVGVGIDADSMTPVPITLDGAVYDYYGVSIGVDYYFGSERCLIGWICASGSGYQLVITECDVGTYSIVDAVVSASPVFMMGLYVKGAVWRLVLGGQDSVTDAAFAPGGATAYIPGSFGEQFTRFGDTFGGFIETDPNTAEVPLTYFGAAPIQYYAVTGAANMSANAQTEYPYQVREIADAQVYSVSRETVDTLKETVLPVSDYSALYGGCVTGKMRLPRMGATTNKSGAGFSFPVYIGTVAYTYRVGIGYNFFDNIHTIGQMGLSGELIDPKNYDFDTEVVTVIIPPGGYSAQVPRIIIGDPSTDEPKIIDMVASGAAIIPTGTDPQLAAGFLEEGEALHAYFDLRYIKGAPIIVTGGSVTTYTANDGTNILAGALTAGGAFSASETTAVSNIAGGFGACLLNSDSTPELTLTCGDAVNAYVARIKPVAVQCARDATVAARGIAILMDSETWDTDTDVDPDRYLVIPDFTEVDPLLEAYLYDTIVVIRVGDRSLTYRLPDTFKNGATTHTASWDGSNSGVHWACAGISRGMQLQLYGVASDGIGLVF